METDPGPLFMVRLELSTRELEALGRRLRFPLRNDDPGYLVHCALAGLFGELAPRPFALEGTPRRWVSVLGYARSTAAVLQDNARAFADPGLYAVCRWDSLATKPMPENWAAGRRLGFDLRACPVVRKAGEAPRHRKGAEVDAFLAACWAAGGPEVPVDRKDVYGQWLADQLDRHGGARLLEAELRGYRRRRLLRRTQGSERSSSTVERPDVRLGGLLEVTDGPAFSALLARGVGRHRAFGFGMLLLRPAGI